MSWTDRWTIGSLAYLLTMFGGVIIANYFDWPWPLWLIPAIPGTLILILADKWRDHDSVSRPTTPKEVKLCPHLK